MTEERFNPEEQDALTERIISRLSEREYKIRRIQEMQSASSSSGKRTVRRYRTAISGAVALAIAACMVAIFVFKPFTKVSPLDRAGINEPTMSEFRSASDDIAEISILMKKPNYTLALTKTEKSLKHLEMQIKDLKDVPYDDCAEGEEAKYEEQQDMLMASELRWTYIYLLVKQEKYKEARHELKRYMKDKEYAEHMSEAKRLMQELQD